LIKLGFFSIEEIKKLAKCKEAFEIVRLLGGALSLNNLLTYIKLSSLKFI